MSCPQMPSKSSLKLVTERREREREWEGGGGRESNTALRSKFMFDRVLTILLGFVDWLVGLHKEKSKVIAAEEQLSATHVSQLTIRRGNIDIVVATRQLSYIGHLQKIV